MHRSIAARLGALGATLLVTSMVVFGALYLAPGSPIAFLSGGRSLSPATLAALEAHYGLDQPVAIQYVRWLSGVVHGDFGRSLIYQQDVLTLLEPRLRTTLLLVLYATVLIVVLGVGGGLLAATRPRLDALVSVASSVGLAVPGFIAAIALMAAFAVNLGWFPVLGPGKGTLDGLWHLTLPAASLAVTSAAFVARVTRAAGRAEMQSEHVAAALVRGIPRRLVMRRHVARNVMVPITTVVGLTSGSLIAGSVIIDQAFSLNGLGSYLVAAVRQHDYPVVQAITLIMVAAFVVINAVVDALVPFIDPRTRTGGVR